MTSFIPNEAYASGTFYGSDVDGNLFTINVNNGAGSPVGNFGIGSGPGVGVGTSSFSTEIECTPNGSNCYVQERDGVFQISKFNQANAALIGGPVGNGGSYTGLEYVGNTLYGTVVFMGQGPSSLHTLNPSTGISNNIGLTGVGPIAGLAYDVSTTTMYGIAGGPGPAVLYTINLNTGMATPVGTTTIQAGSLQFGPDGNLYAGGSGADSGNLFKINTQNAVTTFVGSTGFNTVSGLTLVDNGMLVGGEYFTLDTTALLLAGIQTNALWIIPALMGAAGIGIVLVRKKN